MDPSEALEWLLRDDQELPELIATLDTWPADEKDDPASTGQVTIRAPSRRTMNRSRERRQRELAFFRAQAAELTAELQRLHSRRAVALQQQTSLVRTVNVLPMWERLARHQFQARRQAETINEELRGLVASQQAALNTLKNMMREIHEVQVPQRFLPSKPILTTIRDSLSRSEQLDHLERLASTWQTAFTLSNKFHDSANSEFYDFTIVSASDSELVLRVCASFALPFLMSHVEAALWMFLNQESLANDDDVIVIDPTPTGCRVFGEFVSKLTHEEKKGRMDGAFASQHVRSTDSESVIVAHTYFVGHGFVEGLSGHEDSWMRLTPVTSDATTPLTVGHYVRDVRLRLPVQDQQNHLHQVASLAHLFEVQISDEVAWALRSLENILFSEGV